MIPDLQLATAARAMPGERACGDRVAHWEDGDDLLVAVVDGLGHGPHAAAAADAAVEYVEAHRGEPLDRIISGCDAAIRKTRGVVMTLVRVRQSTGDAWHAGVGNVEAHLVGGADAPLLTTPGVVGTRLRSVRERHCALGPGTTLSRHTDGISGRFRARDLHGRDADAIVRDLLAHHAKDHDDAGCAVLVR